MPLTPPRKIPRIILDASVRWKFNQNLWIQFGQAKLPGNIERIISSSKLALVDRSILNSKFNIDRDFGLQMRYKFNLSKIITNLSRKVVYNEGKITQSLYRSATNQKIPPNIIIEFARIYGFQIDFQRDIRKNDKFQIMYEIFFNEKNEIVETGEILFANLKLSGKDKSLYFFDYNGSKGHYNKSGKSSQKALMKTPINGARLSSPFGMRKHPIDGFNKMHRGTDFAAPTGTPIMASGNGIVKKAGWCGGGGNCVVIKHNSTYQTVYAKNPGAVAAPTAGLHFSNELIESIARKGIEISYVTLHVGSGSFKPVRAEQIEEHEMHSEWFNIPKETSNSIQEAKSNGRRVICVGTTSLRALESAWNGKQVVEGWAETDIFIYPGYQFNVVDALLTNFHLPKSTLMMLVSAFAGKKRIFDAYDEAIREGYRFFSYGDALFLGGNICSP